MNRPINIISLLTAIISIAITISIIVFPDSFGENKFSFIGIALIAFTTIFSGLILYIARSKPSTINISILGFPQSGKTVFLTVLYHYINTKKSTNGVTFIPKGRETIEAVSENMNLLQTQNWLPRTFVSNPVFFFRAIAQLKRFLFNSKYLIEIGDFAGEESQNLSEYDKKWLHKNDYFKYVVSSEIIWLAFDCSDLQDSRNPVEIENSFIAALQIVMDEKGVKFGKKMKTPVCLLLLKADTNYKYLEYPEIVLERIESLVNFCKKNFENFESFSISSVGKVVDNKPPSRIEPINIEKPLVWSLKKSKRTTTNNVYM